ncbi:MAG: pyridoxamine 5'-phosphate oxidase [Pseudomonadota bacterium]
MTGDQHNTRRDYRHDKLGRADLAADPLQQFGVWMQAALDAQLTDATAMALATADVDGRPSVRTVLLKQFSDEGFVFYTDYGSRKGVALAENPYAEVLFYWREFERQMRVAGPIHPLSADRSEAYFKSRPLDSQISAAASDQSQPIASRQLLEQRVAALEVKASVERPERWGGYCLVPDYFEFWQGRSNRLHDRFSYSPGVGGGWEITRLQP